MACALFLLTLLSFSPHFSYCTFIPRDYSFRSRTALFTPLGHAVRSTDTAPPIGGRSAPGRRFSLLGKRSVPEWRLLLRVTCGSASRLRSFVLWISALLPECAFHSTRARDFAPELRFSLRSGTRSVPQILHPHWRKVCARNVLFSPLRHAVLLHGQRASLLGRRSVPEWRLLLRVTCGSASRRRSLILRIAVIINKKMLQVKITCSIKLCFLCNVGLFCLLI